jgi:hypothetical protein
VAVLVLYCVAVISAVGREVNLADAFDTAPSYILAASSALAITMLWHSGLAGNERALMLSLFAALFALAAATFFSENALLEIAPDYLLLLFFSVHPLRANIAETLSPALITEQGENGNQREYESEAQWIRRGGCGLARRGTERG